MKGTILDYTASEAYVLLEDDSVITIPTASLSQLTPIGNSISLPNSAINSNTYKPSNLYDKSGGFF